MYDYIIFLPSNLKKCIIVFLNYIYMSRNVCSGCMRIHLHLWYCILCIHMDFCAKQTDYYHYIIQMSSGEDRTVTQFQISCWTGHNCPNASSLLEYWRRITAFTKDKTGPVVVHSGSVLLIALVNSWIMSIDRQTDRQAGRQAGRQADRFNFCNIKHVQSIQLVWHKSYNMKIYQHIAW